MIDDTENSITPKWPEDFGHFVTERLPLAIFIHATGRLRFLRCQVLKPGKVGFVYDDQEGIGNQVELDFDRGAEASATALFASQKYLRRLMTEKLNIGAFSNVYSN